MCSNSRRAASIIGFKSRVLNQLSYRNSYLFFTVSQQSIPSSPFMSEVCLSFIDTSLALAPVGSLFCMQNSSLCYFFFATMPLDFALFDKATNSGRVFSTAALNTRGVKLTQQEKDDRGKWAQRRVQLFDHYANKGPLRIDTQEELLQLRICPPLLVVDGASDRSSTKDKRKKRVYPKGLKEWAAFAQGVVVFRGTSDAVDGMTVPNPFMFCLGNMGHKREEKEEAAYLKDYVLVPLEKLGLIVYKDHSKESLIKGQPDGVVLTKPVGVAAQVDVAACCEFKSTQNLLLPDSVEAVINVYNESMKQQVRTKLRKRSHEWSRACHPIGQLAGYMIDNKVRYGVLTSGTKTYFVLLQDEDICITPAWFIGQENYLRAWSYFSSLATNATKLSTQELPSSWLVCTPLTTPETKSEQNTPNATSPPDSERDDVAGHTEGKFRHNERKRNGHGTTYSSRATKTSKTSQSAGNKGGSCEASEVAARSENDEGDIALTPPDSNHKSDNGENGLSKHIPFINFDSLKDIKPLGWGRNGTTFRATWNGREVAVKQFDLWNNPEAYETEIEAYYRLKDVWGELVPTPYFLSESWSGNVRFLGMQLGQSISESTMNKDEIDTAYHDVLCKLSGSYAFSQLDWSHSENCVVVKGSSDRENVLVIDLEDVEFGNERMLSPKCVVKYSSK